MADYYLDLKDLSVGYQGKALIHDINIDPTEPANLRF